jgi:hypothetical protein
MRGRAEDTFGQCGRLLVLSQRVDESVTLLLEEPLQFALPRLSPGAELEAELERLQNDGVTWRASPLASRAGCGSRRGLVPCGDEGSQLPVPGVDGERRRRYRNDGGVPLGAKVNVATSHVRAHPLSTSGESLALMVDGDFTPRAPVVRAHQDRG